MENKNIFTAMILFGVIMLASQYLFPPDENKLEPVTAISSAVTATPVEIKKAVLTPTTVQYNTTATSIEVSPKSVSLGNDLFDVVFDAYGGAIEKISLHKYKVENSPDSVDFSVISSDRNSESILRLSGTGSFSFDEKSIFTTDSAEHISSKDSSKVVYSRQLHNGASIVKEFIFSKSSYNIDLNIYVENKGSENLNGSVSLLLPSSVYEGESATSFDFNGPITLVGESLEKDSADDLEEGTKKYSTNVIWTGYSDKFFMGAVVPTSESVESVSISLSDKVTTNAITSPILNIPPGGSVKLSYAAYFGPKDIDVLNSINPLLGEAIDFGFFAILAKPLFHGLKYFYNLFGNYGLAIIFLTIIIKLIFWPLTHKSYSSMKSMQKLGPEMQKLREKYKDDKTRMNQEVMGLYKTHRVNPLGGCLPMVVQIPVFISLYNVLLNSIELRHAPFYLWITDLSIYDPYYITPIIMGGTMFLQQKMNPSQSTMDPNMAKMMMLMPIVFTFIFLKFPAGLVIYWLVNNVLSIFQQYMINRSN